MTAPVAPEVETAEPAPPLAFGGGHGRDGHDDEGGDWDSGRGDGEPWRDDFPFRGAKLAMGFVLFSLSVLFLVTLFVALLLRRQAEHWQPGVVPAFPPVLWLNTLVLLASSVALRRSVRAIASGHERALANGLALTLLLGAAFLAGQGWAWHDLLRSGVTMGTGSYGTIFYWLTGLHAAHVVGGVFFLAVCHVRALLGRYTSESHLGVELCEIYWHFLGVVWIVLVVLLFVLL
jgi:cytochrome c oxidase subunit III